MVVEVIEGNQAVKEAAQAAITNAVDGAKVQDPSKITFGSMGEFKAKYPELYTNFMHAWATQVCFEAKNANDRFVEKMKRQRNEQ